jgi:hypothetical protein
VAPHITVVAIMGAGAGKYQSLQSRLRAAFPSEPIAAADAFTSWGATYLDAEPYAAYLDGKSWDQLDRGYLAQRWDALGFLSTRQLAAVLPAYLLEMLEHPYSSLPGMVASVLTEPSKERKGLGKRRFSALVEALAEPQRVAIASVLQQFVLEHPDEESVRFALDRFWSGYLPADE